MFGMFWQVAEFQQICIQILLSSMFIGTTWSEEDAMLLLCTVADIYQMNKD